MRDRLNKVGKTRSLGGYFGRGFCFTLQPGGLPSTPLLKREWKRETTDRIYYVNALSYFMERIFLTETEFDYYLTWVHLLSCDDEAVCRGKGI